MKVQVFAKLNLTLNVSARQGEFHPIDSVATSVDVCDVVEVTARADSEVRVRGVEGVPQSHNTAYKAACAFVQAFSTRGVDVCVQKGIPFGGGLGGSSADAAAVLHCMCKLYGVDVESEKVTEICARLGSDVSFMLRGGLGRLRGKGDDVEYFKLKRPVYFALTTFNKEMSSREVYAAFDSVGTSYGKGNNAELLTLLQNGDNEKALTYFVNGLQQAARALSDYAEQYLAFAAANGFNAVMTGSGSAYYVAFVTETEAQSAVDMFNSRGFATILCKTVPHGIEII